MIKSRTSRFLQTFGLTLLAGLAMSLVSCDKISTSLIPLTEISVHGKDNATTITVDGGTLQMYAVITPSDATDNEIEWFVTNGTGEASINSEGLLTAESDGNVAVKAASVTVPTINGTVLITISNQAAESKEALISAIDSANDNKTTITISGDGSDVWPDALWVSSAVMTSYEAAIAAAQAVVDNAHATQLQVDNAIIALQNATTVFNNQKAAGIRIANKALLNEAILSAESNRDSAVVSVDGSDVLPSYKWVIQSVYDAYVDSILVAQIVADDVSVKQDAADNAVSALAIATTSFNSGKHDGTKVIVVAERVELGSAENYAVLAKSAISTTGTTMVTGDIAVSPAAGSYLTGFSESMDASNVFSTSPYVTGQLFAADYANTTSSNLTTAIGDMEAAYTTGSGLAADATELFAGDLSGQTMTPGIYKWGNNVLINSELTLNGDANAVWIFQISGTLTQAAGIEITLTGGANPANIFWLVSDSVSVGTGAKTKGIILGATDIAMGTNSSINGRLYSQTAVTLDATIVTQPV